MYINVHIIHADITCEIGTVQGFNIFCKEKIQLDLEHRIAWGSGKARDVQNIVKDGTKKHVKMDFQNGNSRLTNSFIFNEKYLCSEYENKSNGTINWE